MVTIERLLPYSYWIGHPVSNRAIIYLFVGFIPLDLKVLNTLNYIVTLNTTLWAHRCQRRKPELMKIV